MRRVAVVAVARTRFTRMGKIVPTGGAVKVTVSPDSIMTETFPAPPT